MAHLTKDKKEFLNTSFGDRVTYDDIERKLYGHDAGDMPRLIKPLVGKTIPDAVVQPTTEKELVELVKWAASAKVPLTPRGKATSGYGGVLPVEQGIVIDFYRMKGLKSIDEDNLTCSVEAGAVWEQLDRELMKKGYTLRLYPTSYMASTVGGWLAQGGAGIGSYESGWFRDNVESARVVLPSGEVKQFAGSDLDLISDAEGITGLISEVTIKIQKDIPMQSITISSDTSSGLQTIIQKIADTDVPIWSVLFINPRMAEMRNKVPLRQHLGQAAEERVELPEAYLATLTFKTELKEQILASLSALIQPETDRILENKISDHEWENRFKVMLVKRLGPGLVPAEVVVPLDGLAGFMEEVHQKIEQPVVKEGIVIKNGSGGKPEVVILGFIPSDQRKFSYHFVFSLSLSILKIAEKYGGRAYSTGLYFTDKAEEVFGKERLKALRSYKKQIDPKDLINPGKVLGKSRISRVLKTARRMEPLTRIFGNSARLNIGQDLWKNRKDIPTDVAWFAYTCSQCGNCIDECDQFYGRGWESQSPRGKWYWLREHLEGREDWNQGMVNTFLACTTCELCNHRCSESIPIEPSWMQMRGKMIEDKKRMTFPPLEMMSEALQAEGNIWAGWRKNRMDWFPEDLKATHGEGVKAKAVYFAGCTASYVEHDIAIATTRILDEAGIEFTIMGNDENCCGTPMLVGGKWEVFKENLLYNLEQVRKCGADTVITSCPACDMMWRHVYPEWAKKLGVDYTIKARHYSEVVSEKIASGDFKFPATTEKKEKVAWHDSCHAGRVSGMYEPPRDLIRANPRSELVEMAHTRENSHCCGSVLTLMKEPKVAAEIGKGRLDEALEADAQKVLALCPCCEVQLRVSADKKNIPIEVVDLARYTAEALGYDLPDPNPEVRKQWGVFEKMIDLMTPEGFAELMGTMWPELIDAMPMGMGPMMRFMGKIPGALNLMKPLFPILFPKLLPKMMPKVMDTMLARVAEKIPMPDNMADQMPDLMPKVMDSLMPHMIGDVVPLVTEPMINYLRGR
jgi:Fe-S oxidoreductase/FAD/FMN-containing dehydrogenase